MHFAVAPVGSVLPAVAVGVTDFDEDGVDLATEVAAGEVCDIAPDDAGVAGGADEVEADAPAGDAGATGAGATAPEADDFGVFCLPPWPLQAPLPLAVEVVPSLQVVVSADDPAGCAGVIGAAAVGSAGEASVVVLAAFCLPPWPLHAPLPLAVEVVPSWHMVGVVESAWLGSAITNISNGAAQAPIRLVIFTEITPLI